jgi:hypothetical protein
MELEVYWAQLAEDKLDDIYNYYKIVYWINSDFKRIEIANVFDCRQDPVKINETK